MSADQNRRAAFRREADRPAPSIVGEFWLFLKHNKKWWLLPLLIVLGLLAALVVLSGTGLGAFMYTFM